MPRPLYVGAIFKNEAMGMAEWLSHYISFGVEHFYLINDGSTDDWQTALEPYRDKVTLYEMDIGPVDGRQVLAYNKFFGPLRSMDAWFMLVDLDEFIYPPHHATIPEALAGYEDYSQVTVDWIMFGSNGHVKQPDSIRTSFTKRHATLQPLSYKSIAKLPHILTFEVHVSTVSGQTVRLRLESPDYDADLVCNHYQVQSLERWQTVVMTRGCVNFPQHHGVRFRDMSRFHAFDFNETEDLRLANRVASDVTLVITACNRPHLLKKTLASFVRWNTYPIARCILIEDSGLTGINDFVRPLCPFPVTFLYNETNLGQTASIERAYSYVTTPYIFHCEEDWEFYKGGFIERSMPVLHSDPSVITVWLRAHDDVNNHPIDTEDRGGYRYMSSAPDRHPYYGYTTNPGLRRLSDYAQVRPWADHCRRPYFDGKGRMFEPDICILYHARGYRAAILTEPDGFVRHLGWGQSTNSFQHANAISVAPPRLETPQILPRSPPSTRFPTPFAWLRRA
jgi:hypothetical protein